MANAVGRPIAPLVLSSDERAYLERQVRRYRVARSLSERCRVRRFLKDRIEGSWMRPVRAGHERSMMIRLPL